MGSESPSQVYQDLLAAGFDSASAVIMTAIAGAESNYNTTDLGDVSLEDNTWGPSYGLYQVRTLKDETGHGSDRDISWLSASPTNQAKAAYDISKGGQDFTPWTTYVTGAYQTFLPGAAKAAGSGGSGSGGGGGWPTFGPSWLPWNLPSDIANSTQGIISSTGATIIEGLGVLLGVGLVGLGMATIAKRRGTS